jgi:hypothetical protein
MALSPQEVRQIITAVRALPLNAPSVPVEDFIGGVLQLNMVQQAQYFPNPDPAGLLSVAVSRLTKNREKMLRYECQVPDFAVYEDAQKKPHVAGTDTYLTLKAVDPKLRGRLAHHKTIRTALRGMRVGHDLEALAAAIMNAHCDYGEATQGSGDQGIDAIGWKKLLLIHPCFSDGDFEPKGPPPGDKVLLFASSKAFTDGRAGPPGTISPAHIRELVGGWVIQRSSVAQWQKVGIRMLSPVQMVLVTTYRLSPQAKIECRELGIQVWGIPELIYLICLAAPDTVLDPANNHAFSAPAFNAWWQLRNQSRLMAPRH